MLADGESLSPLATAAVVIAGAVGLMAIKVGIRALGVAIRRRQR